MRNKNSKEHLYGDVGLLAFLLMLAIAAVLMVLSQNIVVNIVYLIITVGILIITYFMGIIPSLLANMVFIAFQTVVMLYEYFGLNREVQWTLIFWLVIPMLASVALYSMTRSQIALQKANNELYAELVEKGAFDQQTNLRTTVAYVEDAGVFIETSRRFDIPVTTLIIKIRYFNDLRRMMSERQLQLLLKVTSEVIKGSTRGNDITYLLDNNDPTWAVLLYSNAAGGRIVAQRTKDIFEKSIKKSPELADSAISMVIGVSEWDAEEMDNPYDLMNDGIKETQYDV
ncbi:GGDEF domain-containing protein [Pediococcus acidilactici]|uniref:GGDEF domain-containing protein n=1 Tax=Pediococcus acidilactici TaxID=1254 RepID=UPI0013110048|nr:GGDEF domain-containing protein [Pediococcus acidilactici]KAF0342211.1 GGDEF domain-containing protein [Pediococcus acidilactici]KAF0354066.1 GGDEF domain-containing protein [Pediococcus acidilactici]KAF0357729.1 GGDEF domain-containing protein [Pediococcus acidilactici]KAF0360684.1 GGDEF domain-containing protein [Pediococcus acidilactici]KAF0376581.1 GGDEF domain-containing protein [Pediococcus acidilactici]